MAEIYFPQFNRRRPAGNAPVGAGAQASEIAARSAGAGADIALRNAGQAGAVGNQLFQQSAQELEILRREREVVQETRAQKALYSQRQAAQNEIDLYLTSPESTSHANPEEIPERVGAILGEHAQRLGEQLQSFDATVQENAAFEFQAYGQQIIPGVRREKTSRIRDQAIANTLEFVEVRKADFFRAETDVERQKIFDSMLGQMEMLRGQGFISAEDEEKFQISIGKELVSESITQRMGAISLDTPQPLIAQLYQDIASTSLSPSEKLGATQSLNSHMSYLLNEDARRRNMQEAERKRYEEEQIQSIYDVGFDGGNWKGALGRLDRLRGNRVIDSTSYLQHRDNIMKMMEATGPTRRKHSDKVALMKATWLAEQAGSKGSPIQTENQALAFMTQPGVLDALTESDAKGVMSTIMGSVRRTRNEFEEDRDETLNESDKRLNAWFQEADSKFSFGGFGTTSDQDHIVSNARRELRRYVRNHPEAAPTEIELFTDTLLTQNNAALEKLFKSKNQELYDRTLGLGITTVPDLQNEMLSGRIDQDEFNMVAELLVFRNRDAIQLGYVPAPGTEQAPGQQQSQPGGAVPGFAPGLFSGGTAAKPPADKKKPDGPSFFEKGKQWLGSTWSQFSEWNQDVARRHVDALGIEGYLDSITNFFGGANAEGKPSGEQPKQPE